MPAPLLLPKEPRLQHQLSKHVGLLSQHNKREAHYGRNKIVREKCQCKLSRTVITVDQARVDKEAFSQGWKCQPPRQANSGCQVEPKTASGFNAGWFLFATGSLIFQKPPANATLPPAEAKAACQFDSRSGSRYVRRTWSFWTKLEVWHVSTIHFRKAIGTPPVHCPACRSTFAVGISTRARESGIPILTDGEVLVPRTKRDRAEICWAEVQACTEVTVVSSEARGGICPSLIGKAQSPVWSKSGPRHVDATKPSQKVRK